MAEGEGFEFLVSLYQHTKSLIVSHLQRFCRQTGRGETTMRLCCGMEQSVCTPRYWAKGRRSWTFILWIPASGLALSTALGGSLVLWQRNQPARCSRLTDVKSASRIPRSCIFLGANHETRTCSLLSLRCAGRAGGNSGSSNRPQAFCQRRRGQAFYQKRAPEKRPAWLRTVTLSFPSGRTAEEIVVDDAAGLPGS